MKEGLSGNIAKAFIQSKLTILLMIVFLLIGGYSTLLIPREEEPQIEVPMADIYIRFPGASPQEVEARVTAPLEKIVSGIKGVEYVYSTSMKGQAMLIVQFYVGEDVERSLVKLYNELMKHMNEMPQGASMPLVKTRAIDDVPVFALTLWSEVQSDFELRQIAQTVSGEIKKINDVAAVNIIGGRSRQLKVTLDKDALANFQLDLLQVRQSLMATNAQSSEGKLIQGDHVLRVQSGNFLTEADDFNDLVVGSNNGNPVYLKQVATVEDAPEEASQYAFFGFGKYDSASKKDFPSEYPAVTLSITKKKGADAMKLTDIIRNKVNHLTTELIPSEVQITETRNYGETASHKVSELLLHLVVAIIAVTVFVMMAMGWRGGLVVFLSVPVTFALTLFSYYLLDYTLNRITLFALVFITGIVVDDSIIIAENMHRHFKMKKLPFLQAAIFSINEVGNPTILATFTVIAAVLPMAFVSGMMGPYMSPMPIGASIAMMLSLVVALTLTPYLGYIFLKEKDKDDGDGHHAEASKIYKLYHNLVMPMLETRWKRWAFMLATLVLLIGSLSFFYTRWVAVKMLPFDNKNEFQVIIDMPEGTTLERTAAVTREIALFISKQPLVRNYQAYVGNAAPISFNGLVRHYDIRTNDHTADIQVNLVDKSERATQSHELVKQMRPGIQQIAERLGANVKLVEVPPGPPVLSTIVAEIYGPDYSEQIALADRVKTILKSTAGVVDVDWMTEDEQREIRLSIDHEKAMKLGVAPAHAVSVLEAATAELPAGALHQNRSFEQIPIVVRLNESDKNTLEKLSDLRVTSMSGRSVSLSELVTAQEGIADKSIYRKNQKRVVFVMADLAGNLESPAYAMMEISRQLSSLSLKPGYTLSELYNGQPDFEDNFTLKWDGEWQITYEVFRDLGIAFLVVIILIYMLIVGWFQDFAVPVVMLVAIPLSLIGIVIGHWIMGAYFTATSMIGFIALAGVMVRNSVLLIDFINIRLDEGTPLKQAIIEAGAVRTTPILLTAGAVVLGAVIILFDPIFQGLAISLMGGTITSTFLTLVVVPLIYFKMKRDSKPK